MNLGGEIRESISLDEDDLSDIEDEVFIRDGKRGYKFEDVSVKKPLMAPRRKIAKSNISTSIRSKPHCKALCKPCCYAFFALAILIGLMAVVTVLVSLFPLPIDKLKNWVIFKPTSTNLQKKTVQCSNLEVTEIWKVTFPKFTSETPVRTLDINQDDMEDIIFGYNTGDDNQIPSNIFCPMFMNTSSPCGGGVMALNGSNGKVLWQHWLPGPVFDLICTTDFNNDNVTDCLITGKSGIFRTISTKDGETIWNLVGLDSTVASKINVYLPSIIPDQDNDNVSEIVASHSIEKEEIVGHIIVISGRNGTILQEMSTPDGGVATYCKPQFIGNGTHISILFGTGSLNTGGGLYLISMYDLLISNVSAVRTVFKDNRKGILSPSVIVDITGDEYPDIVTALFNSTVIAVDGRTLEMLWNFTISDSETLSVPIPGYFNNDNVTDFLVKYQTGPGFPTYYYSQTYILDGKNGKPIYKEPFIDNIGSQMGGLTISSEDHGFDWFLYWTTDCVSHEGSQDKFQFVSDDDDEPIEVKIRKQIQSDLCLLRFNSSTIANLFAVSQFDQLPGFKIYDSLNDTYYPTVELMDPVEEARWYMKKHSEFINSSTDKGKTSVQIKSPLAKFTDDFNRRGNNKDEIPHTKKINRKNGKYLDNKDQIPIKEQPGFEPDYEQPSETWFSYQPNALEDDLDDDYNSYLGNPNTPNGFNSDKKLLTALQNKNTRDPRSKSNIEENNKGNIDGFDSKNNSIKNGRHGKALKKNLSEAKYGMYDYQNIQNSQKRLMSDLNTLPSQILRETYFKDKFKKFEERDLNNRSEQEDLQANFDQETYPTNVSFTLWDLESENEMREKETGNFWRGKRTVGKVPKGVPRTTTVGSLLKPMKENNTGIDLVIVTYWVPSLTEVNVLIPEDFKCVEEFLKKAKETKEQHMYTASSLEYTAIKKCLSQRGVVVKNEKSEGNMETSGDDFPYYREISKLRYGALTVHRLNIQCKCGDLKKGYTCSKFSKLEDQRWTSYLGNLQNGFFKTRTL